MTVGSAEHAAQFARRGRSLILRNMGDEYAENICNKGGSRGVAEADASLFLVITFMASNACNKPIVPTTGPIIPPSAQLVTLFAGGGLGKTHR